MTKEQIRQDAEKVYSELNQLATEFDHYDYGLPSSEETKEIVIGPLIAVLTAYAGLAEGEKDPQNEQVWRDFFFKLNELGYTSFTEEDFSDICLPLLGEDFCIIRRREALGKSSGKYQERVNASIWISEAVNFLKSIFNDQTINDDEKKMCQQLIDLEPKSLGKESEKKDPEWMPELIAYVNSEVEQLRNIPRIDYGQGLYDAFNKILEYLPPAVTNQGGGKE